MPSITSFRRRRGGKGDRRGRHRRSNKFARAARAFGRRVRRRRSSRAQARQISKIASQVGKFWPTSGPPRINNAPRRLVRRRDEMGPPPRQRRRLNWQGPATDAAVRALRVYMNARREAWMDGGRPEIDYAQAVMEIYNHINENSSDYREFIAAGTDYTSSVIARLLEGFHTGDSRFERM